MSSCALSTTEPTSANKKVAAFAHFVRSSEHGSESRAGNFRTFYESGCQGRTAPALIAEVFHPWQPAPLFDWARPFGLPGFAGQSSSASFSSGSGTGSIGGRGQASGSRWANHGSICDSAAWAGLTLLQVQRGGLSLGESLVRLMAGRTPSLRLLPAPGSRTPEPPSMATPLPRPRESGR